MLGTTLGGRYQIYRYLGGGGFGRTYLARDQHLPGTPDCVVKQLKPRINHPRAYDTACRLFNQEAQVLYLLGEHARIPRLFAHFEEQQEFYLVQEFVDGDVLSRSLRTDHCMGEVEVWQLLKELLTILAFVHEQRVIHRDIKPSNLIRRQDGTLMVIDFGGVKQINNDPEGEWTITTMAIGSAGYMPNEQLAGRPRYSSDIYAAGMVALRAVTGRSPAKLPEDIRTGEICWRDRAPHISTPLASILTKMTRYDFRDRYTTAAETLTALDAIAPVMLSTATHAMPAELRMEPLTDHNELAADRAISLSNVVPFPPFGKGTVDTLPSAPDLSAMPRSAKTPASIPPRAAAAMATTDLAALQPLQSQTSEIQQAGPQPPEIPPLGGQLPEVQPPEVPVSEVQSSEVPVSEVQPPEVPVSEVQPPEVQWPFPSELLADIADDNTVTESMPYERIPVPRNSVPLPPPPSQMRYQQIKRQHPVSEADANAHLDDLQLAEAPVSTSVPTASTPQSSDHYRSQGDQYFQDQQYGRAITAYGLSLRAEPDDYILWFKQAMALEHLNRHEEAIACYHKVLQLQPQDYLAWSKLGKALETLERYDDAVDAYTQVLQLQPQNYWAWHDQGRALEAAQHIETAIASYDQAIQLKPDFQLAIDSRKRLLSQLKEVDRLYHLQHYDEALQSCLETVQTNPDDPLAWLTQGMTLENAQHYQAAVDAYDKVITLDPQDTLAQFRRAGVLEKLGHYQSAAIAYRNVTRLQADNYWAWNDLGRMLETLQRYDQAMVAYNKAITLQPTLDTAIAGRDRMLRQLQQRASMA